MVVDSNPVAVTNFSALVVVFSTVISPLHCADPKTRRSLYYVQIAVTFFGWSKWFDTHRKKLEQVNFVEEEFQYKKINIKDFYMWIMLSCAPEDIFRKMHVIRAVWSVRLSGVRVYGDLTGLN